MVKGWLQEMNLIVQPYPSSWLSFNPLWLSKKLILFLLVPSSWGCANTASQRGGSQSAPRFRLTGSQTLRYQFLKNTTRAKINKCNHIKLKSSCTAKETINTKRQPTKWEKTSENHKFDKRLISKIHKELMQLNSKRKKKKVQLKNGQRIWIYFLPKTTYRWKDAQITNIRKM